MYSRITPRSLYLCFAITLLCLSSSLRADPVDVSGLRNPEDPWEGFNRKIYVFNDGFDRYFMLPIASAYRFILPEPVDQGMSNFFANLLMPLTIANSVFQLKFKATGEGLARFFLNSTVGVVGFIDVASRVGIEEQPEDFGQTLGYWGVPAGPYVELPFLRGRTLRDALSLIPDWMMSVQSSIDNLGVRYSLLALQLIDVRADLIPAEQLITGDRYIFLRDAYLQQRRYLIADGEIEDDFGEDDFDDDMDAGFDGESPFDQESSGDMEPIFE